jgi:nucleoside-diphosphate-sugar epimerase
MNNQKVGVLGASSMVGRYVIDRLAASGYSTLAFSRNAFEGAVQNGVRWHDLSQPKIEEPMGEVSIWVSLCPIWALAEHFELIKNSGVRRIVALSSTSRFTKTVDAGSRETLEHALAKRLEQGETVLRGWAEQNGIEWVILRPTLIYDLVSDKNLLQIETFIRRYGFFPLLGKAQGRRQPVHVSEVAGAVFSAMTAPSAMNKEYNISGGETLTYREMVERIFRLIGREPRFIQVPMTGFAVAIYLARIFPRYRHISRGMVQRMNRDMVFDHENAKCDLGYSPSSFLSITKERAL